MDWQKVIDGNREKLLRIVALLLSIAGLEDRATVATLPRCTRNYLYRLLRPAESAVRRLIFIAARGMKVKLPTSPLRGSEGRVETRGSTPGRVASEARQSRVGVRTTDGGDLLPPPGSAALTLASPTSPQGGGKTQVRRETCNGATYRQSQERGPASETKRGGDAARPPSSRKGRMKGALLRLGQFRLAGQAHLAHLVGAQVVEAVRRGFHGVGPQHRVDDHVAVLAVRHGQRDDPAHGPCRAGQHQRPDEDQHAARPGRHDADLAVGRPLRVAAVVLAPGAAPVVALEIGHRVGGAPFQRAPLGLQRRQPVDAPDDVDADVSGGIAIFRRHVAFPGLGAWDG